MNRDERRLLMKARREGTSVAARSMAMRATVRHASVIHGYVKTAGAGESIEMVGRPGASHDKPVKSAVNVTQEDIDGAKLIPPEFHSPENGGLVSNMGKAAVYYVDRREGGPWGGGQILEDAVDECRKEDGVLLVDWNVPMLDDIRRRASLAGVSLIVIPAS